MEFSLPDHVPAYLAPSIELAVRKAQRDFPQRRQSAERIGAALFSFAEIVCKASEDGEMPAEHAHASLERFLHTLCAYDPASNECGFDRDAFDQFAEPLK